MSLASNSQSIQLKSEQRIWPEREMFHVLGSWLSVHILSYFLHVQINKSVAL